MPLSLALLERKQPRQFSICPLPMPLLDLAVMHVMCHMLACVIYLSWLCMLVNFVCRFVKILCGLVVQGTPLLGHACSQALFTWRTADAATTWCQQPDSDVKHNMQDNCQLFGTH